MAAAVVFGIAGCGEPDVSVGTAEPAPTPTGPWPWEKYPPTGSPTSAPATPSSTDSPEPSSTPDATTPDARSPSPTEGEPEPDTSSEPEESAEPDAPSEPDTPDGSDPPPSTPPAEPDEAAQLEQQVVVLTEAERQEHGCDEPLRADDRLRAASRSHSADMATRNYFDHTSPDGDGPGDRAAEVGYPSWAGENIALGYTSAQAVVDGWMASEGHRENILNCDARAIGVGVADSERGMYWTQMFGYE